METKDKATLFKGYMAGLFSSQDGTSLQITDWRNTAWWNVPVKLGECNTLKKEAINIFWKCWQFSQPEYETWLWKISIQRQKQCNKSQRESHRQCALPVGMWSCLDDRSLLEEAVEQSRDWTCTRKNYNVGPGQTVASESPPRSSKPFRFNICRAPWCWKESLLFIVEILMGSWVGGCFAAIGSGPVGTLWSSLQLITGLT